MTEYQRPIALDAYPGEGTRTDLEVRNDNLYANQTGFELDSATSVGDDFQGKLQRVNDGRHPSDGEHSHREAQRDKTRIAGALCSQLELTSFQQSEVLRMMDELNLDDFGNQKRIETVSLGVIRCVVEKDRLERNPDAKRISEEDQFKDILDDLDIEMSDLLTVKRVLYS